MDAAAEQGLDGADDHRPPAGFDEAFGDSLCVLAEACAQSGGHYYRGCYRCFHCMNMSTCVLFLQAAPEGFFPGRILTAGLAEVIFPEGESFGNHLVYHSPVGQAAEIAVIDEQVGLKLAG